MCQSCFLVFMDFLDFRPRRFTRAKRLFESPCRRHGGCCCYGCGQHKTPAPFGSHNCHPHIKQTPDDVTCKLMSTLHRSRIAVVAWTLVQCPCSNELVTKTNRSVFAIGEQKRGGAQTNHRNVCTGCPKCIYKR